MGYLKASDTLFGQEGRAYATIDGQVEEMFYIKRLTASVEKNKVKMATLGKRALQHKAAGYEGRGEMTIYYVTSLFRRIMCDYMKHGRDLYFDIQVTNEDPTSAAGRQTVVLKNVNLDSVVMAALDVEAEALEEDVSFTFDDVEILQRFTAPELG